MKILSNIKNNEIDVLFIAEGTYPFIRGGVSTWIDQIIKGMPDLKFGVLFLGSRKEDYDGIKYDLPKNLLFMRDIYLFSEKIYSYSTLTIDGSQEIESLIDLLKEESEINENLKNINFYEKVSLEDFLYGRYSWLAIEELYLELNINIPFKDFFWTVRNILYPLWILVNNLKLLKSLKFSLIHSPSTGYAGFLGSLLKRETGKPLLITEHGIYTKERKIDILNSKWIKESFPVFAEKYKVSDLKRIWVNFFINIGKICYEEADIVLSLFDRAKKYQIELGCPPEKTKVIPNGIDVYRYKNIRRKPNEDIPRRVALIGRVTPIKDVKTFIKAIKMLVDRIDNAEGWVVGPEEEDPQYVEECKKMVKVLGLEGKLKFLGFKRLEEVLPHVGIVTLTSISEGMPLVLLEAFAAGIPCVATDVGSCRQLIHGGLNKDDKSLGSAGFVVPVGNPRMLAECYAKLLTDKELWFKCSSVAVERVEKFYSYEKFIASYKSLYIKFMEEKVGRRSS